MVIVSAASISVKNLFSNPFRERLNAYNSKLTWADGSTSDCIAFLNVYKVCIADLKNGVRLLTRNEQYKKRIIYFSLTHNGFGTEVPKKAIEFTPGHTQNTQTRTNKFISKKVPPGIEPVTYSSSALFFCLK